MATIPNDGFSPRSTQRGAALLVLLVFVLLASAAALVERMQSAARNRTDDIAQTAQALAEAKAALIGYAVNYPENYGTGGPGFLPCPDTDNDGSSDTPCASNAIGRLPWQNSSQPAAQLPELRDATGEHLWYAVTGNYRNNPKVAVLNSETAGGISLDGGGDIVAVIIAPGAPLEGQDRGTGPTGAANYLEGDNATGGDGSYTARGGTLGVTFNDTIAVITRAELMVAVERRVIGDVAAMLARYRISDAADYPDDPNWNYEPGDRAGVYPWLSPFTDPSASLFKSSLNTRRGHLALHWAGEVFTTSLRGDWDIDDATVNSSGSVSSGDIRDEEFTVSDASCTWLGAASDFDCTASRTYSGGCLGESGISIQRTYQIQYSGEYEIRRPKDDRVRQRRVRIEDDDDFPAGTTLAISIVDVALSGPDTGSQCGAAVLLEDGDTNGDFRLDYVRYDIGLPEELPSWFYDNQWHHLIYVAESDGNSPDGDGSCSTGSDCLVLSGSDPSDDKRAVVIAAGAALAGQSRSGSSDPADYFELANAVVDDAFTRVDGSNRRAPASPTLNDQVRVVEP